MSFIVICGVIVILRNSMQGFGDRVIPVFSSCIELAGKIIFAFVFAPMFAYWGIIWAEPMVWIAMVIPLIVLIYIGRTDRIESSAKTERTVFIIHNCYPVHGFFLYVSG